MKRLISILLCLVIVLAFVGCSKSNDSEDASVTGKAESQKIQTVLTPAEYVLYQNIFFNGQADDYVNKQTTKDGVFTAIYDAYSNINRYYVWGYNDNTKCCDWQWEIVPNDLDNLPKPGSRVNVNGVFVKDEKALDGYWISDAKIDVITEYTGSTVDIDTTTMGGTLERVQLANIQSHPDKFEGKTVTVYGRADSPTSVEHPYYDNCFTQEFSSTDEVQAIGTKIVVSGTYSNGVITNASVNVSNDF